MRKTAALLSAAVILLLTVAGCGGAMTPSDPDDSIEIIDWPDASVPAGEDSGADVPTDTDGDDSAIGSDADTTTDAGATDTTVTAGGKKTPKKTTAAGKGGTTTGTAAVQEVITTSRKTPTTTTKKKGGSKTTAPTVTTTTVKVIEVTPDEPIVTVAPPTVTAAVEVETAHKPLAESAYYQYSTLSGNAKKLYQQIGDMVSKGENVRDVSSVGVKKDVAAEVLQKYMADHPQQFWLARTSAMSYNDDGKLTRLYLYYTDGTTQDEYNDKGQLVKQVDWKKIAKQTEQFGNKVEEILKKIPTKYSAVQKERAIYDYMTEKIEYDNDSGIASYDPTALMPRAFDAYGAITNGLAVCEGYAKLFQYLCYCVGINATAVYGISNGGNHMWNAVQIDGNWYHADVTWDDNTVAAGDITLYCVYQYFNLTDAQISVDHAIDNGLLALPACTATAASFANQFAMRVTSFDAEPQRYQQIADQVAADKAEYFFLAFDDGLDISQEYLVNHLMSKRSAFAQYLREKKYGYSLVGRYLVCGQYAIMLVNQ